MRENQKSCSGSAAVLTAGSSKRTRSRGNCKEKAGPATKSYVLGKDGELDRARIADAVFADERLRLAVNAIIHPAVKKAVLCEIEEAGRAGYELFVLEAALLIEDHYDEILDEIWYVYAPRRERIRRLVSERGYSQQKAKEIMRSQLTEKAFRAHADRVIDNGGSFEQTKTRIGRHIRAVLTEGGNVGS